jgi:hypothetical protein
VEFDRPPFNPDLVRALHELVISETPAARRAVYEAIVQSELILPTWNKVSGWGNRPDPKDPVRPLWIGSKEGNVLPVFTDWRAVTQWQLRAGPKSFATLSGRGIFAAAVAIDASLVLINPDGPIGLPVGRAEIDILASGAIPDGAYDVNAKAIIVEVETYVCLGPAIEPPPDELVLNLNRVLTGCADVGKAFFFEASFGRGSQLTLGLAFTKQPSGARVDAVMHQIGRAITGLGPGKYMDSVVLQGDLLRSVERTVPPFFEQGR